MKEFAKLSLFLSLVASVCIIIGQATPYWLSAHGHYQGLWEYCFYLTHSDGGRSCTKLEHRPDFESTYLSWIQAVRVMVIISCVTSAANAFLHVIYLMKNDGRSNFLRIRVMITLSVSAAVLCIATVVLYAAQKRNGKFPPGYIFGWSFILTAIAGAIIAILPIPLMLEIRKSRALGTYESI